MRRECKMVCTYDELDDSAKAKAREWYAQLVFNDSWDWEFVYEDAELMAGLMGIEIDRRAWTNARGYKGSEPCIYFSGFSSQGDGACFEGSYRYKKGAVAAIKKETGFGHKRPDGTVGTGDKELIRIATELQAIQRKNFYKLRAACTHKGPYYHSYSMSVDVEDSENKYRDLGDAEVEVRQLMRDFADWIYDRLEAEYDYLRSDEAVEESILANEYEFYESGELV